MFHIKTNCMYASGYYGFMNPNAVMQVCMQPLVMSLTLLKIFMYKPYVD